jgi:hypothetical protein
MTRFQLAALALAAVPALAHAQTTPTATAQPLTIAWQDGPQLITARDHHSTFLVQRPDANYLYVVAGTNYVDFFDSIERARINADGSLGAWELAGKTPTPRGGTSVAVVGDYAVLTGGQVSTAGGVKGLTRIAEVFTARIGKDGSLGEWQPAAALPEPRFHHPAVANNGWIYVVGGQGEKEAAAGVFAARLTPAGKIESWQQMKPLPRPRSHHAAFVHDNHIYVTGGMDGPVGGMQAAFLDVIRAPIQADGTLGDWQIVSRIPHSYATHASHFHGGFFWLIGGVEDNARFVGTVLRAELRADGRVGGWSEVTPGLPVGRGHVHNTPTLHDRIYSAGGRTGSGVTAAVHVGTYRPAQ